MINSEVFKKAFDSLPEEVRGCRPLCGLILGSGWGQAIVPDEVVARIRYAAVPGLGASTVAGHSGELLVFKKYGGMFMAFMGRRHWYEGVGWEPVLLPIELMRRCRAKCVLLTNAAGAVSPKLQPGDLMLLRDHINTTGLSPLQGPIVDGWGPRFPDLSETYDCNLTGLVHEAAKDCEQNVFDGVYAFTGGPTYETPSEIKAYGLMGADAVGMSTVPEAIVAHAAGLKVAALSCITNMAAGIAGPRLFHEDVLRQSEISRPVMAKVVDAVLKRISERNKWS